MLKNATIRRHAFPRAILAVAVIAFLVTAFASPAALACVRCHRNGAHATCLHHVTEGYLQCHVETEILDNGLPVEQCYQSGECSGWTMGVLDEVHIGGSGEDGGPLGSAGGPGAAEELVPLAWICVDDIAGSGPVSSPAQSE